MDNRRNLYLICVSCVMLIIQLFLFKPITSATNKIPIVAISPFLEDKTPTTDDLNNLIDCGFNVGLLYADKDKCDLLDSLIGEKDFKLIITNLSLLDQNYKKFISELSENQKILGWRLVDEPRYDKLSFYKEAYQRLKKEDPKRLIYINLVGALMKQFCGPSPTYQAYLDTIQEYFNPEIWSYDLYPFSIKNDSINVSYDIFYYDLESFKNKSQQTGKPFWAYCQSMAFRNKVVERPAATETFLRFEAFNALAYGAQGIVYWTYAQRESAPDETYFSALLNLNGEKSPAWHAAQKVNSEIKKYNDIFVNSKVIGIKHTGKIHFTETTQLKGSFGPFKKVKTGEEGVLLSHFSSMEGEFIIIINHDVKNSQTIRLFPYKNKELIPLSDNKMNNLNKKSSIEISLDAGGYIIFKID